jgi:hypothetical protein
MTDSNKYRTRQNEIKYSEAYHKRILPNHWKLLAEILHANSARNILQRDDLMFQLAKLTGQGIES